MNTKILNEVLAAYSDCHEECQQVERNLKFKASDWVDGAELIEIMKRAIPHNYNNFDEGALRIIVGSFGVGAIYKIAREGSPAIYVKHTGEQRLWLNDRSIEAALIDELSLETDGTLRLWWD